MDPVAQTLAQQQSGSAEGQGFGDYFIKGRQLNQQQQQINLSARRVALEEAQGKREQQSFDLLRPYAAKNAGNQAAILGQQVQINTDKLALMAQVNNAMPEILQLHSQFMEAPDGFSNPALRDRAESLSQRYPRAFAQGTPGSDLLTEIYGGQMFKQKFQQLRDMDKQMEGTGMRIQQFNPKTGNMEFMRDTPAAASSTSDIKNFAFEQQLKQAVTTAPEGPEREAAQTALRSFQEQTAPKGYVIRTTPDGGTEIIQGSSALMTQSQTGRLREQAAYATDTAKRIEDLKPILGHVFGPGNATSEIIVDKALSNFAPQLMDKTRVQGREAAKYVKEGLMRSLNKGQGQLSDKDVTRLENLYPALKGFEQVFESPQHAREVLTTLQQQIARDAYVQGRIANQPPDPESLAYLSPRFLSDEFLAGRLDADAFRKSIEQSPYRDEVNELLRKAKSGGK